MAKQLLSLSNWLAGFLMVLAVLPGCSLLDLPSIPDEQGSVEQYAGMQEVINDLEFIGSNGPDPYSYWRFRSNADTIVLVTYSDMPVNDTIQLHNIGLQAGRTQIDIEVAPGWDTTWVTFPFKIPRLIQVYNGQHMITGLSTEVVSVRMNGWHTASGIDNDRAVLFIGNSIMNGYRSTEPQLNAYVKRIMHKRPFYDVYTFGFTAAGTAILYESSLSSTIDRLRSEYDEVAVFVHLGVNDLIYYGEATTALANMDWFLDRHNDQEIHVVELMDLYASLSDYQVLVETFNATLPDICSGSCQIVTMDHIGESDLLPDGVHPTNAGHAGIFQIFNPLIDG